MAKQRALVQADPMEVAAARLVARVVVVGLGLSAALIFELSDLLPRVLR